MTHEEAIDNVYFGWKVDIWYDEWDERSYYR